MAKQKQEVSFEEVVECGCGLDFHKKEIMATVSGMGIEPATSTFQSTTRSLTVVHCLSLPPNHMRNLIRALAIKGAVALETELMALSLLIDRPSIS